LLFHPQLKLFSRPAQDIPAHRTEVPIGTEKAHHSLGLLERLDDIRPLSRIRSKHR
jgi:hypothetical protein